MPDDESAVSVTEGATIEVAFPGSPGVVRAFQTSREWGVVATDVPPADAIEIEHAAPADGSTWDVLRAALLDLADAGAEPSQIVDYLALERCGIAPAEWARRRGTMTRTVEKSRNQARSKRDR